LLVPTPSGEKEEEEEEEEKDPCIVPEEQWRNRIKT
jgi:hypothetical protein